ncbi:hypothetical protein MIR68_008848 [Amoeboaphelidium protococcarum]|nr:hypothetical protein MIR68_008848 [Amoeboaphelidium protococcarum]
MSDSALFNAFAGSVGASLALSICYPLDITKTRLQVQQRKQNGQTAAAAAAGSSQEVSNFIDDIRRAVDEILHGGEEFTSAGRGGDVDKRVTVQKLLKLYNGLPSAVLGTFFTNFAYFWWYSVIRGRALRLSTDPKHQLGVGTELLVGAMAGGCAQLITIPISVITTHQQVSSKAQNILATALSIIKEDGVQGLWSGIRPALILTVNPAITYGLFEKLKSALSKFRGDQPLSSLDIFFIGMMCKTIATMVTYPYIMAKTRLQAQTSKQKKAEMSKKSALGILFEAVREEGPAGMYRGMEAQIIKAVLTQALLFVLKDEIMTFTLKIASIVTTKSR